MKAIVYHAPGKFVYEDVPDPAPRDDEVVIATEACGLCRTDMHIHQGRFLSRFPLINGHEIAGNIVEIGRNVKDFRPGQRVVADNTELCGHCFFCRRDEPLFCENFISHGCNVAGGFADYMALKAEKVFPIHNLSDREAIMAEPTACALHGMDVIRIRPGSEVLLYGAGPTGLILAQLARLNGAAFLAVAAPPGKKLDMAKALAADAVYPIDKKDFGKHRNAIRDAHPRGFDTVIEATGIPELLREAIQHTRTGGQAIAYGVYPESESVPISPYDLFRREITVKGSFAQTHCFGRALLYLESGKIDVRDLVTHEFSLKSYGKALDTMEKGDAVKILLHP